MVEFNSSKEALDSLVSLKKGDGLLPKLILIDLTINGEEGVGFLVELEKIYKPNLVVLANKSDYFDVVDMFECVLDYIRKPLDMGKVGRIIGLV